MESIFEREGYDPGKVKILVIKTLSGKPKMIKTIKLEIIYPEKISDLMLKKLERAMATCPVRRSLNDQVQIEILFKSPVSGPVSFSHNNEYGPE